jgi:glycosyl transferase family 1
VQGVSSRRHPSMERGRMKRPLRSVMLANGSYLSSYVLGVAQAMGQLGHWHREVSVLDDLGRIARQLDEMRPDVIWTHTIPWVPREAKVPGWVFLDLLADQRRRGARVLLHDGDPRSTTRHPYSIAASFDLALCNHRLQRSEWKVPTVRWPYAAMAQREIGEPVEALRCGLLFAGIARKDDELYSPRTELLGVLHQKLGERLTVRAGVVNDRMQVADVAASAQAVLGYGRPEVKGWTDTRIFQYSGAGGVLLHDDAAEFLEPSVHFLHFSRGADAEQTARGVVGVFEEAERGLPEMRRRAFEWVQAHHTWRHRVEQVLALLGVA